MSVDSDIEPGECADEEGEIVEDIVAGELYGPDRQCTEYVASESDNDVVLVSETPPEFCPPRDGAGLGYTQPDVGGGHVQPSNGPPLAMPLPPPPPPPPPPPRQDHVRVLSQSESPQFPAYPQRFFSLPQLEDAMHASRPANIPLFPNVPQYPPPPRSHIPRPGCGLSSIPGSERVIYSESASLPTVGEADYLDHPPPADANFLPASGSKRKRTRSRKGRQKRESAAQQEPEIVDLVDSKDLYVNGAMHPAPPSVVPHWSPPESLSTPFLPALMPPQMSPLGARASDGDARPYPHYMPTFTPTPTPTPTPAPAPAPPPPPPPPPSSAASNLAALKAAALKAVPRRFSASNPALRQERNVTSSASGKMRNRRWTLPELPGGDFSIDHVQPEGNDAVVFTYDEDDQDRKQDESGCDENEDVSEEEGMGNDDFEGASDGTARNIAGGNSGKYASQRDVVDNPEAKRRQLAELKRIVKDKEEQKKIRDLQLGCHRQAVLPKHVESTIVYAPPAIRAAGSPKSVATKDEKTAEAKAKLKQKIAELESVRVTRASKDTSDEKATFAAEVKDMSKDAVLSRIRALEEERKRSRSASTGGDAETLQTTKDDRPKAPTLGKLTRLPGRASVASVMKRPRYHETEPQLDKRPSRTLTNMLGSATESPTSNVVPKQSPSSENVGEALLETPIVAPAPWNKQDERAKVSNSKEEQVGAVCCR